MYEIPTERLELGEDQYAVIFKELKHGTKAAVEAIARQYMHFADGSDSLKIKKGDSVKMPKQAEIVVDLDKMDHGAINDVYLLRQVKEWSFGNVNELTLAEIPSRFTDKIIERIHELYKNPLPETGGAS